jgi:hypothetical protein
MGSQAEGMKRLTPASFAASARGICWSNSSVPEMQQMRTSMSEREETKVACGESRMKARMGTPREASLVLAEFETEVGRVKEMMLLGVMLDGCERRPLTIEEPVWPVAPRMPIVGDIVEFVTGCRSSIVVFCYTIIEVLMLLYTERDWVWSSGARKHFVVRFRYSKACTTRTRRDSCRRDSILIAYACQSMQTRMSGKIVLMLCAGISRKELHTPADQVSTHAQVSAHEITPLVSIRRGLDDRH